jgi:hypothetical protein
MPPSPGPGSRFAPTSSGYDVTRSEIPDYEVTDPIQTRLYSNIRRRIEQLSPLLPGIGNSHPFLANEIADYIALVNVGLNDLDVPAIWSAGSALRDMIAQLADTKGSITPSLEPEPLALLNALMRDDIAFVQGFGAGRALTQRVRDFQLAAKPVGPVRWASRNVLSLLKDTPHLLAERAQRLVAAILRAIESAPDKSLQVTVAASETAYNFIVEAGRYIQSFGDVMDLADAAKLALIYANVPHPDVLEASVVLFRDHGAVLLSMAAVDGQVTDWLRWLVRSLGPSGSTQKMPRYGGHLA